MKLTDMVDIIKAAVKNRITPMVWGAPGIGKSAVINELVAQVMHRRLIDVRLAQLDPTDMKGIPVPDREANITRWFTPEMWPKRGKDGKCPDGPGIIFFDEIDKAPIAVKNAALQIVLDYRCGDYVVPDDWSIVCAGNREEDGAFSQPMGTALANRMIHLEVDADLDVWSAWAREHDIREEIIGFLHLRQELLYKHTGHHAFPSPRSWAMASRMWGDSNNTVYAKTVLKAAVGETTATEFEVWRQVYSKVDPAAVLERGDIPNMPDDDQSFKYAVTLAVAFQLRKKGLKSKPVQGNLHKFLKAVSPELRVLLFRQQTPALNREVSQLPIFADMISSIMTMVDPDA